ncbi:GtrA family protein, partial [Ruminococcus sp.]|uniref:GtrA family protein n=1 Tax=Ruminococcus sp. TaxID=41978 RepID=UPI00257B5088
CSLIGNVCGFIFTFMTNTLVNFKKRSEYMKTFASYATICIAGSLISTLLIHLLKSSMNIYILKFMVMIFVCLLQYFLNRTITYKN